MHPRLHEFEKLFHRVLNEINEDSEKNLYLLRIFNDLIAALGEASALHFNTLFARVSYISTKYQLTKGWSYALQIVRKELRERNLPDSDLYPILKASIEYLVSIYKKEVSTDESLVVDIPPLPKLPPARHSGRFKKKFARVVAVEWDRVNKQLSVIDEDQPDFNCVVHYDVEGKNDIFADTLELGLDEIGLPLILGLTDIESTEENHYIPGFIVIMPDLLMDVTSVATTWSNGSDPLAINLINQFLPSDRTDAILVGQVANFFLDELIRDSTQLYEDLFTQSFKIYPVEFVQLSDDKLKGMYRQMKSHFDNIKSVIDNTFPIEGIDKRECVIEPSYFSPQYGIKGRLDLYYQHEGEKGASIIELKSGKAFKPNSYGLNSEHYHQTLLYELLIKSVHGPTQHRMNYILYSSNAVEPLRFAVSVESIQKETIQNRNQLVLLQFRLMKLDHKDSRDVLNEITPERNENLKGFIQTNIQLWHKVYSGLSPGEQSYMKFFTAFITREHMLARIGNEGVEGAGGLAGLWLDKIELKEERYQILQGLELMNIEKSTLQTILTFKRSEQTNPLANFRAGDIAIMYPYHAEVLVDPTKYQLHRANVLYVDAIEIVIRLRNNQVHTDQIEKTYKWNIEHDLLDSSFRSLFQSLWTFLAADIYHRQLIFGLSKPVVPSEVRIWPSPDGLTQTQQSLYQEALSANNLYLLWGPPGTGKTSRMLKSWVWYYFNHTNARIALLAYTNKAVDEICQSLHDLGEEVQDHYIRIGSRAASGEKYKERLLDKVIEPMNKRASIRELLDRTRIFVGTLASLQGKSEIFKLVRFDVAIIDEASQILEPAMAGLLTRFKKTILIGDHMQLPAVCTQSSQLSKIKGDPEWAKKIGLTDMSMSYFERIYRLYNLKGWYHVIGNLSEQGRMHLDIQRFSNQYVYQKQLTCLHPENQKALLNQLTGDTDNPLFHERLVYLPTRAILSESYLKTNQEEADKVIEIISLWQAKFAEKNMDWSIGVITPFRAQIAAILHKAHLLKLNLQGVSVDTVERYQGGARDVIIMSCAVNNRQNLSRIVSLNAEGVDRKLNVAVTRARQQFILLGSEAILSEEKMYKGLIEMSVKIINLKPTMNKESSLIL